MKANFIDRVKANLVDSFLIILLIIMVGYIIGFLKIESAIVKGVCFILILLYEPIFVSLDRTLGQRIMGLRVIQLSKQGEGNESKSLNLVYSLFRYQIKILLGWVSLVTIHFNDKGRAIHDLGSDSQVIVSKF